MCVVIRNPAAPFADGAEASRQGGNKPLLGWGRSLYD